MKYKSDFAFMNLFPCGGVLSGFDVLPGAISNLSLSHTHTSQAETAHICVNAIYNFTVYTIKPAS